MARGFAAEAKKEEEKEGAHHVRDAVAARSIAGMPETLENRVARISRPTKSAMQSGTGNVRPRLKSFFFLLLPCSLADAHLESSVLEQWSLGEPSDGVGLDSRSSWVRDC